jgi:hypothetical protein
VRRGYRNAIRNSPQMANSSSESRELDILSVRQKGGKCGKGCRMGNMGSGKHISDPYSFDPDPAF